MLYAYPELGGRDFHLFRLFGCGLGNLLFPWARARVGAKTHNLRSIAPTWPQFKLGPILRREADSRLYQGLFRPLPDEISGVRKSWLLATLPKISPCEINNYSRSQSSIVYFPRGTVGLFSDILTKHEFVRQQLIQSTYEPHKAGLNFDFSESISVHVRLGDFRTPKDTAEIQTGVNSVRIPLSWYLNSVQRIRELRKRKITAYVFSDGSNSELRELLALEQVVRLDFGSSIADLLALSRSNLLIASASTFSMWASYLGRMPVIFHKGQHIQQLYPENKLEIEVASDDPFPTEFEDFVRSSELRSR